jgi:hypothetical protein
MAHEHRAENQRSHQGAPPKVHSPLTVEQKPSDLEGSEDPAAGDNPRPATL